MKSRLVRLLRCPACRSRFESDAGSAEITRSPGGGVVSGTLVCTRCAARYAVTDGVPRLLAPVSGGHERERAWTASRFGYLWAQASVKSTSGAPRPYHFEKIETALGLLPPHGLVLDAGCGDGIDLANMAQRAGVEVVGVELSDGGCAASFARTRTLDNVHVVQGDLSALPFEDETFDAVYSYGVVHHLTVPARAIAELARAVRRGGMVAIYVYEDLATRTPLLRAGLRGVNALRPLTTRMPPRMLFGLCEAASPLVYAGFTIPHLILRHVPGLRAVAAGLPFRHGSGPFALAGDLYDRFSAPVELRFSRAGTARLLEDAGLTEVRVAYERGWMAVGVKP